MTRRDRFPGQRMAVIPQPLIEKALQDPITSGFLALDCGYFPKAEGHLRRRPEGINQGVLILCAKGEGWCENKTGRTTVKPGEVVLLAPGEAHAYGADPRNPWSIWWVQFTGTELKAIFADPRITGRATVRPVSDPYRAMTLISEIIEWAERDHSQGNLSVGSAATRYLLAIIAADTNSGAQLNDHLERVAEHIRLDPAAEVSVPALAEMVGLSASHLSASFKNKFEISVHQYRIQRRMALARELLDTTSLPISNVAAASGYPDAFYFSRHFRGTHGITPSAYRAKHKG